MKWQSTATAKAPGMPTLLLAWKTASIRCVPATKANNPDLICQMYAHQQLAESICADFPNDPKCLNIIISNQGTSMSSSSTTSQSTRGPRDQHQHNFRPKYLNTINRSQSGTVVRQSDGSYIVVYGAQSASTQSTGGSQQCNLTARLVRQIAIFCKTSP